MKIKLSILLAAGLLFSCKYGLVKKPKSPEAENENQLYMKEILKRSENGYWLVVRGYKVTDHLVATATLTDYSHAALLDVNAKRVIEADATGIHESSLEKFIDHSYTITVVKPFNYTKQLGDLAVNNANAKIGKAYDFLGTVGFNSPERYYCSELVVYCYPSIKDSVKLPPVIKPAYLLELGTLIYESPVRKIK